MSYFLNNEIIFLGEQDGDVEHDFKNELNKNEIKESDIQLIAWAELYKNKEDTHSVK